MLNIAEFKHVSIFSDILYQYIKPVYYETKLTVIKIYSVLFQSSPVIQKLPTATVVLGIQQDVPLAQAHLCSILRQVIVSVRVEYTAFIYVYSLNYVYLCTVV